MKYSLVFNEKYCCHYNTITAAADTCLATSTISLSLSLFQKQQQIVDAMFLATNVPVKEDKR